ncbi:hypothetical protein V498_05175 [Pseudogymnoascus sp. VKM F-4517 (FW-2822)]|nr:hypothetical protein V498_05175 [Pseudogymnoascus sp. VKM F-4517 (FW-2822)]
MSGQPPSSPAQAGAIRAATPVESKFLAAILKNSDGVTNIDWDTVAIEAGYNNAATAKVRFGQVKRALGWTVGSKTSPVKNPNKVEKKPAKPRAARKPKTPVKKKEEVYKELLSEAADDDSNGDDQDDASVHKQEHDNDHKQDRAVYKTEEVDEDEDTMVEEEDYTSANDYA